jgi:hypothetical protein
MVIFLLSRIVINLKEAMGKKFFCQKGERPKRHSTNTQRFVEKRDEKLEVFRFFSFFFTLFLMFSFLLML